MALTLANYDALLKENYDAKVVMDLVTQRHPLFTLIPKDTGWTGDYFVLPVQYGNPQAIGSGTSNFSTIASNLGNSSYTKFALSTSQHYGFIQVNREAFLASADQDGAFADALDRELRSILKSVGLDMARQLFGDKNNQLGQIDSVSGGVITLTNARDAKKFEIGMRIMADDTATGASPRSGTGVVSSVNYADGTVTYTGTITSIAASDYLFREGSITSAVGQGLYGLASWLPQTAPTSGDSHFGVDRSVSSRLYGQILDASGLSVEEAFIRSVSMGDEEGGMIDLIVTDHATLRNLESSLQSNKTAPAPNDIVAKLGYKEITMINGAAIVADRFCPSNTAYALELDSWILKSRSDLIHFVEDDGRILLRNATSDSVDARVASYCQLGCHSPIHNVVIHSLNS